MNNGKPAFGKEPIPKTWRKIGRHSTQGFTLSDMVSPARLQKVARDVIRFRMSYLKAIDSLDETLYRLDSMFRTEFFAKKFGELDMPTAAEIYVDCLEQHATTYTQNAEEAIVIARRQLRSMLLSLDPKKFFVYCFHYGWPVPESLERALVLMHTLRLDQSFIPEYEQQKSRDWLAAHVSTR